MAQYPLYYINIVVNTVTSYPAKQKSDIHFPFHYTAFIMFNLIISFSSEEIWYQNLEKGKEISKAQLIN